MRTFKLTALFFWGTLSGIIIVPRLILLTTKSLSFGLGYDELQSVTHAFLPVKQLIASVATFDPHPPLYYLQLHGWMLLFGSSDLSVKGNSLVWGVAAVFSLYFASKSIFGKRISVMATCLFALSPLAITYANEVRMYAMLMCLAIWVWFFTHHFLNNGSLFIMGAGTVFATIVFLYSHGTGFLILAATTSYAVLFLRQNREKRYRFGLWIFTQLIIFGAYTPWLFRAQTIHLGHLLTPNFENVAETFTILLFGFSAPRSNWLLGLSLVIIIGAIIVMLTANTNDYLSMVSFVAAPLIACLAISYWVRPIFLPRTLAFLAPFLSLVVALAFFQWQKFRMGYILFVGFAMTLFIGLMVELYPTAHWGSVEERTHDTLYSYAHEWPIKHAVNFVEHQANPGDIIYVPHPRVFWGWSWYHVGVGSVNPLQTNYELITKRGLHIISSPSIPNNLLPEQTYWLVYRHIDDPAPFLELGQALIQREKQTFSLMTTEQVYLKNTEGK